LRKKLLFAFMAVVLVAGTILAGCAAPAEDGAAPTVPAEKVYKWNVMICATKATIIAENMAQFCERVNTATDGRMELSLYFPGEIVDVAGLPEALATNSVQMGRLALPLMGVNIGGPHYSPLSIFGDPLEYNSLLFDKGGDEVVREAMLEMNIHWICSSTLTGSALISTKEVKNLDDCQGLLMREFGTKAALWNELGASVTYIPYAELYMALTTGVVESTVSFPLDIKQVKFYEPCKFMMLPYAEAAASAGLGTNLDAWNELPGDLQEIVTAESQRFAFENLRDYASQVSPCLKFFQEEGGMKIGHFSDADVAKIRAASVAVLEEEAKKDALTAEFVELLFGYAKELGYID